MCHLSDQDVRNDGDGVAESQSMKSTLTYATFCSRWVIAARRAEAKASSMELFVLYT